MWKTFVLLFCLSVTLGVGYSASNGTSTTVKPTTTAKPTTGNTTAKPTTGNTTAKPTTGNTTAKPTTGNTTAKPTTGNATAKPTTGNATAKPTTGSTTAKPTTGSTTAKPTNGSTTAKPTTGSSTPSKSTNGTTTVKSTATSEKTTTVLPTTPPPPPYGNFSLRVNKTKEYCLLAQFAVTFTINYRVNVSKGNSSESVEKNGTIYLGRTNNKDVTIGGDCGLNSADAKLVLTWPKNNSFYNLTMVFSEVTEGLEAKSNKSKWRVKQITLTVNLTDNPDFKNATEKSFISTFNGSSGPTYDVGGYYSCNAKDATVKFNTKAANYSVQPVFEDVRLEPFVSKNASDAFGKKKYPCYQDNPTTLPASTTTKSSSGNNDIVPIAVGCALAGLVLIVLIAYIIGRRKSHRGYEKV